MTAGQQMNLYEAADGGLHRNVCGPPAPPPGLGLRFGVRFGVRVSVEVRIRVGVGDWYLVLGVVWHVGCGVEELADPVARVLPHHRAARRRGHLLSPP